MFTLVETSDLNNKQITCLSFRNQQTNQPTKQPTNEKYVNVIHSVN